MPAIAVIPKRVNEKFEVMLRYSYPDILSGETIVSANVSVPANDALVPEGSPSISGNTVSQWISAGTSGNETSLTFLTTVSSGRILEHYVVIAVDD